MRKYITIVLAIVVLAAAFGISKKLQNRKKPSRPQRTQTIPLAFVKTTKNIDMPVTIPASGSLTAKNKIRLYSEVQGVLNFSSKEFKPGVQFKKGEVIYKLNSDEFYTNLLAQRSSFQNLVVSMMPDIRLDYPDSYQQWQTYIDNFDITKTLVELPAPKSNKEKRFVSAKNIFTNFYNIKNLEIKLRKYTVIAPFNGVLTEASVTPGSLVSPGQLLGEFVNPKIYELEISINSEMVSKLAKGDKVEVVDLESDNQTYHGEIVRINEKVDLNSQTVNVFIDLSGHGLKEGMYLRAYIQTKVLSNIIEIPRNLLVNRNQVFVVKDSMLHLKMIKVVHQNDQTIIISGLENNQNMLTKPVPKAFEGMKVSPVNE